MNLSLILIAILMAGSSLMGGLVATKLKSKINYLLGLVAGLMMGVVAFDLFPEIFNISNQFNVNIMLPMIGLLVGFLGFHFAEQYVLMHTTHEKEYKHHSHSHVGKYSIYALIVHRFLDGLSIGLAFQINAVLGLAVSIAVIAHSFIDGLNIISISEIYNNKNAMRELIIGSIVPVLGIGLSFLIKLPEFALSIYLGTFAGLLIYLAASDILPEAHREKPKWSIMGLTILGAAIMYFISSFLSL
jgi:ZIP family zinc transporter